MGRNVWANGQSRRPEGMESSQPTGRSDLLAVLDEPRSQFATIHLPIYLPSPSAIEDAEQQFADR